MEAPIFALNLAPTPHISYCRPHHETLPLFPSLGFHKTSFQDHLPCCLCCCCCFFFHNFHGENHPKKKWRAQARHRNQLEKLEMDNDGHEMEETVEIEILEIDNEESLEVDNDQLKILLKDKTHVHKENKQRFEMDKNSHGNNLEIDKKESFVTVKNQLENLEKDDNGFGRDNNEISEMDRNGVERTKTNENGEIQDSFWEGSSRPLSSKCFDDTNLYSQLLRSTKSLSDAYLIHRHIIECGHEHLVFLGNLIVQMYSKCGSLEDSSSMFDRMQEKNKFSWTIMIGAFIHHHKGKEALLLFQQLRSQGIEPDKVTCVTILSVCANVEFSGEGKSMHTYIVSKGIDHDVIVGNALVNMYGKCGLLEDAMRIFLALPNRNAISWNGLITAFAQHGKSREAIILFKEMESQGENPNLITFVSMVTACASQGDLHQSKEIHAKIAKKGIEIDGVIGNALINMYSKCGSIDNARIIFDQMTKRNVVTWNAMLGAYAEQGQRYMSVSLFKQMLLEGFLPDKVTYISMLEACAQIILLDEGKKIHTAIIDNGLDLDLVIQTSLIYMYSKCGSIEDALSEFHRMPMRDVVAWNAMIEAYIEHLLCDEALTLFQQMQLEGVRPDTYTYVSVLDACAKKGDLNEGKKIHARLLSSDLKTVNALVETALLNMYGKCGKLEDAWSVFDNMSKKDVIPWNALIASYVEHNQAKKALNFFEQMQIACILPDEGTFISLLDACGKLIAAEEGYRIHCLVVESGFEPDTIVGTALITMYGRCGCLDDAQIMFSKMFERCVVSWTALITMQSQHGQAKNALKLFAEMKREGKVPTKTTFVSVLSACSRAGLINEGWSHFQSMSQDYGLEPSVDHYNCMIDLLGRAGHLKEAEDVISSMLISPNATSWITLLSACKTYLDVERGVRASLRALELEPDNDAAYVLLSNLYAAAGRWEDVEITRMKMEERGLKKEPGCSSIKINDQLLT